jgi:hypothetical protein
MYAFDECQAAELHCQRRMRKENLFRGPLFDRRLRLELEMNSRLQRMGVYFDVINER